MGCSSSQHISGLREFKLRSDEKFFAHVKRTRPDLVGDNGEILPAVREMLASGTHERWRYEEIAFHVDGHILSQETHSPIVLMRSFWELLGFTEQDMADHEAKTGESLLSDEEYAQASFRSKVMDRRRIIGA